MTPLDALLRGMALGLAVAAPVGPVGLLCLRRAVTGGFTAGLASGFGVAAADLVYAVIAAFGLGAALGVAAVDPLWPRLAGAALILWIGLGAVRRGWAVLASGDAGPAASTGRAGRDVLGAFLLTLSNPMTIASFAGLFAGLGLGATPAGAGPLVPAALATGVFLGSLGWWVMLSAAGSRFGRRLGARSLARIDIGAGLALMAGGIWLAAEAAG
ncbi:LysE family translocator [Tistrella mobilis]|uniref:Lysine exporter protein LysE/YggA n=1 Tax=Tistrella mobilis (strain KA081020-065) TaxID=1110502 RepID=I3TK79_TISMK|nr:LysE family transporter [Tistrella mobilis]AFK53167.1 lysine exporter protein LysE/YggA [Tistrella mobilis KA081020-065]